MKALLEFVTEFAPQAAPRRRARVLRGLSHVAGDASASRELGDMADLIDTNEDRYERMVLELKLK